MTGKLVRLILILVLLSALALVIHAHHTHNMDMIGDFPPYEYATEHGVFC